MTDTTTIDPRLGIGGNRPSIQVLTKAELIEDHADLTTDLDGLRSRASLLPEKIATDSELLTLQKLGQDVNAFLKKVEVIRVDTGAPYLAITNDINSFFNVDLRNVAKPLKDRAERMAGAYNAFKAEEKRKADAAEAEARRRESEAQMQAAAEAEAAGKNTAAETYHRQAEVSDQRAQEAAASAASTRVAPAYTSGGTVGTRYNDEIAVDRAALDLEALRPFLTADALEAAIKARRRIDKTPIKGVTVTQVPIGSFR